MFLFCLQAMSNGDATPTGMANSDFQSPNSEMKWTPLQLACITKDHGGASAGAGGGGGGFGSALPTPFSFEIHSPNRKHSLLLREVVSQWLKYSLGSRC